MEGRTSYGKGTKHSTMWYLFDNVSEIKKDLYRGLVMDHLVVTGQEKGLYMRRMMVMKGRCD